MDAYLMFSKLIQNLSHLKIDVGDFPSHKSNKKKL